MEEKGVWVPQEGGGVCGRIGGEGGMLTLLYGRQVEDIGSSGTPDAGLPQEGKAPPCQPQLPLGPQLPDKMEHLQHIANWQHTFCSVMMHHLL